MSQTIFVPVNRKSQIRFRVHLYLGPMMGEWTINQRLAAVRDGGEPRGGPLCLWTHSTAWVKEDYRSAFSEKLKRVYNWVDLGFASTRGLEYESNNSWDGVIAIDHSTNTAHELMELRHGALKEWPIPEEKLLEIWGLSGGGVL